MQKLVLLIFVGLLSSLTAYAQTDTTRMGVDDLYSLARDRAFSGDREGARRLCSLALEKSPDYHEIAVLLGRTYSWDGRRDEARAVFNSVLRKEPAHVEATLALADVELWDDKPTDALTALNKSLSVYPNNIDLLIKKAKALIDAKRENEALLILSRTLEMEPGCSPCAELKRKIKENKFKHTLSVNVAGERYSDIFDPMYYSALQFGTTTKAGSIIGRVNYAHRFGESGVQPEVDFYPGLWKKAYAYLNYGYTSSSLFAQHRIGAELFQSLPHSFEASLGLRHMEFRGGSAVTIYTASLGWYYKNYWFSGRTYITPSNGSFSRSLNITARRYFADANNYIGITAGGGFSPDARRIQTNEGLLGNNIYFLKSQKIELNWQKSIRYNVNFNLDLYYSHQELSFSYGEYVHVAGLTAGFKIRL